MEQVGNRGRGERFTVSPTNLKGREKKKKAKGGHPLTSVMTVGLSQAPQKQESREAGKARQRYSLRETNTKDVCPQNYQLVDIPVKQG